MVIKPFSVAGLPEIFFGAGTRCELPRLVTRFGHKVILVTGASSLAGSGMFQNITEDISAGGIEYFHITVKGEPTPEFVDHTAEEFRKAGINAVVSIGGGSVIDAGKAVSAMLTVQGTVTDFLEGVGTREHPGGKVPFIAVPTTAGTGSEATKNAVLSRTGPDGFKKSLRHNNFVPDIALVDPELALSCPPDVTAASGLDAFTQLLESYVSTKASPFSDALALSGLAYIKDCLVPASTDEGGSIDMRAGMAYAALISGITLANAGLGVVHGIASPLGGLFNVPHGVVCGTLVGEATKMTVALLRQREDIDPLMKFARAGALLTGHSEGDVTEACNALMELIEYWTETLAIPRLGAFGIGEDDIDPIAAVSDSKNSPVSFTLEQIKELLRKRL